MYKKTETALPPLFPDSQFTFKFENNNVKNANSVAQLVYNFLTIPGEIQYLEPEQIISHRCYPSPPTPFTGTVGRRHITEMVDGAPAPTTWTNNFN